LLLGPGSFGDFCVQENAGEELPQMPSSDTLDPMDQNTSSMVQNIDSAAQIADSMDQC